MENKPVKLLCHFNLNVLDPIQICDGISVIITKLSLKEARELIKEGFESFVNKLISENIEELYFNTLETKEDGDTKSGLGLLMMLKDYPVRFGYSFKEIDADTHEITVRAVINVEEI
jgi:hypothetical protein